MNPEMCKQVKTVKYFTSSIQNIFETINKTSFFALVYW